MEVGLLLPSGHESSTHWYFRFHSIKSSVNNVLGSDRGGVEMVQMQFNAVHSLHLDRYAFRDNLTEVVVQHLVTDRKVRIKCRDLVRALALYRNKLAVQLTDKICVYESNPEDFHDMHFKLRKERISTVQHPQQGTIQDVFE